MYQLKKLLLPVLATGLLGLSACDKTEAPAPVAEKAAETAPAALIERSVLFGNPQKASGRISPDGRWLGYLAPDEGVMNVWVEPSDFSAPAKVITKDRHRGIRGFSFAYSNNHVLFGQDQNGDENFHVYAVDLSTGEQRDLSPHANTRASVSGTSRKFPGELLISMNNRSPQFFDIHRVDIASGKSTLVQQNDGYSGFVTDNDFAVRFASRQTADGGQEYLKPDGKGGFTVFMTVPQADSLTTNLAGFTSDGKTYYMLDSRERDTAALFAIDAATDARTLVHEDARADINDAISHPITGVVQAAAVNYLRTEWKVLDSSIEKDLAYLQTLGDGEISIESRSDDDIHWIVSLSRSDASSKSFRYDRSSQKAELWYDTRPALATAALAPMHAVEIPARDGLKLVSYYTLPAHTDTDGDGKPSAALPMVLLVHGGPWARDAWGLNGNHQWLANRGYVVLSVNFRGSTGFGKSYTNAGDMEWGKKMHDDLLDAVKWAVDGGIAQKDKVAIMGGSYGGYATLAGVTMTPTEFACGVDIVGPSNLITLLDSIPPYWAPIKRQFYTRMGNPETEEGRALLVDRSPLTHVDKIQRPLLIGQGANDPRVKQAESDQIVTAMKAKNIPVTYVLFPDEGHGFNKPENRMSFNAVTESFLGKCLGGRVEAPGAEFANSSITIPEGVDYVEGIAAALKQPEPAVEAPAQ